MATKSPRFVLVDTNCFLRLYQSPVLPLLGQDVNGCRLLTLDVLVSEFLDNGRLVADYPWVAENPKRADLDNARLKLKGPTKTIVEKQKKELAPYARAYLADYCNKRGISPARTLSVADLELLATAVALKAVLATDEWPLSAVVKELMAAPDDYNIGLFSSLDVLSLLERSGLLSAEDRRGTVDAWIRGREQLPRDWRTDYERLFEESTDALGAP